MVNLAPGRTSRNTKIKVQRALRTQKASPGTVFWLNAIFRSARRRIIRRPEVYFDPGHSVGQFRTPLVLTHLFAKYSPWALTCAASPTTVEAEFVTVVINVRNLVIST
jgi:hypothetical protein